jgi:hypothetical protein
LDTTETAAIETFGYVQKYSAIAFGGYFKRSAKTTKILNNRVCKVII